MLVVQPQAELPGHRTPLRCVYLPRQSALLCRWWCRWLPRHGWCMADSVVPHGVSDDLLRVAIAAHLARYKGLSRAHTLRSAGRCAGSNRPQCRIRCRWWPASIAPAWSTPSWTPPRPHTFAVRRSRASHRRWHVTAAVRNDDRGRPHVDESVRLRSGRPARPRRRAT